MNNVIKCLNVKEKLSKECANQIISFLYKSWPNGYLFVSLKISQNHFMILTYSNLKVEMVYFIFLIII